MSTNEPACPAPAPDQDAPDARTLRAVLVAVSVALMAVIASVSGLNVAQTHLAVEFGVSHGTVLWIINIYTLTLAALLLPLGAIGDRLGRKPVLVAALVVFGVAGAAAGLAPTAEVMLAARVVGGIGAAMIMPITLAVITSTFPEEQRGRAIGVWTGVAGGGGILGMFLSALLVDVADWRWLFLLPVVLVAVALAMTLKSVPDSRESSARPFDTVGALTSAVAVVGLIFALQEGPEKGWTAPATLVAVAGGLAATAGFVAWERHRRDTSLLDVRLFRERGLADGSVTLLVVFGVQAGIAVVLFPFLQAVLGWSGLPATLALMPMAVVMMLMSGLAPRIAAGIGARRTTMTGVALGGTGLALMALFVSADGGYVTVLPGMLAMGIGMGLSMTPGAPALVPEPVRKAAPSAPLQQTGRQHAGVPQTTAVALQPGTHHGPLQEEGQMFRRVASGVGTTGQQRVDVGGDQTFDLLLVSAHPCPSLVTDGQLRGGVEQSASAEGVLADRFGAVDVGVEHGQHAVPRVVAALQARAVPRQPLLVPGLQVGQDEIRLGGEVVVQAHLRHPGLGGDGVDARRGDAVGVETPRRRGEDPLPGRPPPPGGRWPLSFTHHTPRLD